MIEYDLPFQEYGYRRGASASVISKLAAGVSPLKIRSPRPPSPAMRFGTALHALILEPERTELVMIAPDCDRRTKAGKAEWAEFMRQPGADRALSTGDYGIALAMRDALRARPDIRALLDAPGFCEVSVFGERDDCPTKCRADKVLEGIPVLIDLKTTRDASERGFRFSVRSYGYDVQAAWYMDRLEAETCEPHRFIFMAVESEPPHDCALYELGESELSWGRTKVERGLDLYKKCVESGHWPGYGWDWEAGEYRVKLLGDDL